MDAQQRKAAPLPSSVDGTHVESEKPRDHKPATSARGATIPLICDFQETP